MNDKMTQFIFWRHYVNKRQSFSGKTQCMKATPSSHIRDDCVHTLKLGLWGTVATVSLLTCHRVAERWHSAWSRQWGKFCILILLSWPSSHPQFSVLFPGDPNCPMGLTCWRRTTLHVMNHSLNLFKSHMPPPPDSFTHITFNASIFRHNVPEPYPCTGKKTEALRSDSWEVTCLVNGIIS